MSGQVLRQPPRGLESARTEELLRLVAIVRRARTVALSDGHEGPASHGLAQYDDLRGGLAAIPPSRMIAALAPVADVAQGRRPVVAAAAQGPRGVVTAHAEHVAIGRIERAAI